MVGDGWLIVNSVQYIALLKKQPCINLWQQNQKGTDQNGTRMGPEWANCNSLAQLNSNTLINRQHHLSLSLFFTSNLQ